MTPEQFEAVAAYVKNAIAADEKTTMVHDDTPLSWWLVRIMAALGEVASTPAHLRARYFALLNRVAAIAIRALWHEIRDFAYLPEEVDEP